ncbi:unnamed protein product [Pelagomonas calceolata]|uniref:Uncharacterized protein n=1 Tax=Pelagomonas calceolata TaxID=35677 RepID=A0A8J2S9C0_9STRA|nr:unnamed protein product [Pelagomonas calceolata]
MRACVLHVSLTVALVPPVARPPSHVCSGAAYDYCIQSLGCTAVAAGKAERGLLPNIAESLTRTQIDCVCDWLQSSLDLSDAELKKVILWAPSLLGYSVEKNIAPKLEWLQNYLDLDEGQLRKIVLRQPTLLGRNMAPKLEWVQRRLDLDNAQLKKMVVTSPSLLSISIEDKIEPNLDWLQTRLDLDAPELRKMVLSHPPLLYYSVEDNLEPKLNFLEEELGLPVSEVRASIVTGPNRLSYSLNKRYRARLEVCRAAGVDAYPVLSYSSQTDAEFCKRAGVPLEALRAAQEDV